MCSLRNLRDCDQIGHSNHVLLVCPDLSQHSKDIQKEIEQIHDAGPCLVKACRMLLEVPQETELQEA